MARRGENIYKRKDGRYEGRYVIGKRPDGTTRFGYVFGRQYSDVKRRLMQKKAEIMECQAIPAVGRKLPLGAWMRRWLETEILGGVKPSSYQTYANQLEHHLIPALGSILLHELEPADIRDFLEQMQEKGLSESTIRSVYRLLGAGMRSAQAEGLIRKNPAEKIRPPRQEQQPQRVLTVQEQTAVRDEALRCGNLPALLALYTGMRLGEICALKWTDVNWQDSEIRVCRTVQRIARRKSPVGAPATMLMVGTPKSIRSQRVLPVPAFLMERLRELMQQAGSEFIFGRPGRSLDPRTIQRRLTNMTKRLDISGVHFHTLRHSFATRLIEMGVDIKTVSVLLGHESTKTTLDFYAHSLTEHQRSAVERLAALM